MSGPGLVLACNGLNKVFPKGKGNRVVALESFDLTLKQGEIVGLVGADGAGKTTLLRLLAGLLEPTSGSISLLGRQGSVIAQGQQLMGYMPQRFGLYQDLTVAENLDFYADMHQLPRAKRPGRFTELLEVTELAPFRGRRVGKLSGGMKQKLGLACALIHAPPLLLLDEPTVGVDPGSRRELWRIIRQLVEQEQSAVLVSTSYLDEVQGCQRVMLLHQGKLVASGPPRDFSSALEGRVYRLAAQPGASVRDLQGQLNGKGGIVDMTIRSGQLHLVLEKDADIVKLSDGLACRAPLAIDPCFEDAFMALVPREDEVTVSSVLARKNSQLHGNGADVLVEAVDLQKYFGDFAAVKGISFAVKRGEIFGLLGPNGAGKSTTFRMLCGLLAVTDGEVSVAGRDLRRARARARANLGYVAQIFSLYGPLSVLENLTFYGKAYGLHGARLKQRIDWALTEFGLAPWQEQPAGTLPCGYRQRLAMAVAMLHEPAILFLDEPTSGADPLARREFWLRINGFARQGVTVIVTTHFMEEAEFCDRMLIMAHGRELAQGTPEEIRRLARTHDNPEPSIEDAFIFLAERQSGEVPA